jgi:putative transposase
MPDHLHLLWVGILAGCDQRLAVRFFRKHLNPVLEKLDARFQQQPYDHVLKEDERQRTAFEEVVEYIARNPERAGLVESEQFRRYPYTGSLVPGYPELRLWQDDFWERFWRVYPYHQKNGLTRAEDDDVPDV